MNAKDYQEQAARTLIPKPGFELSDQELMTVWNALGLAGEAGEVAEVIKKGIFHQHGLDMDKLKKEIGDVLWYAAALCTTLNLNLSDIMQENIDKLKTRYPDGFSSKNSKQRADIIKDN
jgi:NTP pyrophosphatase (non-canonical NTP hydrolase)